nr:MAG TPA: hypothetical protein [Bacteriophage sp.]
MPLSEFYDLISIYQISNDLAIEVENSFPTGVK